MARRAQRYRTGGHSGTRTLGARPGADFTTARDYRDPAKRTAATVCAVCPDQILPGEPSHPVSFVGTVHARCNAAALVLMAERAAPKGDTA